jgi:hypothetical protein
MSSRISLLVDFLPTRTLDREIHFQYSLNPARCQRTSVSGCTRINALVHPDQRRRSEIQSNRSPFENLGCGRRRAKTASCCRNARFSKSRSRRARKEPTNTPNISLRRRSMAALHHRKHDRFIQDGVLTRDRSDPLSKRPCRREVFRSTNRPPLQPFYFLLGAVISGVGLSWRISLGPLALFAE